MNRFFDIDGPLITGLTKVADILILNILLILCSLPIFTFGASYTAMYYVTLKMVKDEESYTVKSFFKSFKLNFKQATVIWLIMLAIGSILYFDLKITSGEYAEAMAIPANAVKGMSIILLATAIIYTFTIVYVFPVLSRFDNSVKNTIKNALLMSIRHFPYTIAIILITFVPIVFMYLVPRALILVLVIFALCAYCNSYMFVKIFSNYMPEENIVSDENFQIQSGDDSKNNNL